MTHETERDITYAMYGETETGEREYIGSFDDPPSVDMIARWQDDYPSIIVSRDRYVWTNGGWESDERRHDRPHAA